MSSHDQGAAYLNGMQRPRTKKALREAMMADPVTVVLASTSMFGGYIGSAAELPEGITFTVVGPDPETDRRWYANVKRSGDKVTVS